MKERRQLIWVSVLQGVSALMDVAGVLSIMPFLAVAVNPELLRTNAVLIALQRWASYSDEQFLALLGVLSLVVLIVNQAVRLGSAWYATFVVPPDLVGSAQAHVSLLP